MGNPIVYVPSAALPRIVTFDTEFETALATAREQWHVPFTYNVTLDATELKVEFPVITSEAQFRLFDGVPNFRALSNKFFNLTWREWQDGVKGHINQIVLPTFHGWDREPQNMAQAAMDLRVEGLGTLLMNPPTLQLDGLSWFNHAHPQNPIGPVAGEVNDNDMYSQAVGVTALDNIDTRFMSFKGALRKPLRMRLTDILAPTALYQAWNTVVNPAPQFVNQGGTNKWRGQVNLIHAPEIDFDANGDENTTTYFALSRNRNAKAFVQVLGKAWNGELIETRYLDMNSDEFKKTGMLHISKILRWDIAPAEPVMSIIRVSTAAEP